MNIPLSSLATAVVAALLASPALAQTEASAPAATANTLDTVIVTGTRVSDRTVAESQSPIDIISAESLAATGTPELATALARALPSLNFPRPALSDGTSAIRPAQLRGLSPDQVLVLVNGKRRHTSSLLNLNGTIGRGAAAVDLNTIPVAAIARVEVLRDGASAQYGSDAIAGVVNIVLKGTEKGGSLQAGFGQYSAGDGNNYELSGDTGVAYGGDRGWLHVAAQLNQQDPTDRARGYAGAPSASQPAVGQKAFKIGDPQVDAQAASLNTEYQFSDTVTGYAFATASNRNIDAFAFFRAPGNTAQNIVSIYPQGFLPEIQTYAKDRALVAGVRGATAGGWDWDASYNYGYNRIDFHTRNTLNVSLGPTSPTEFYDGALETTQNIVNLDVKKGFDWGLAYPVTVAFGAEYRNEKWNQSPGEPGSYFQAGTLAGGAQGFGGFAPSVAGRYSRDSYALYADIEADLTDKFSAGLAGRYEDYSDFGNQTSGKLSARYAFSDKVALRGTVASGFRAPSLAQQYFQSTSTTFLAGNPNPFEIRTFPANSTVARALGAEPLDAETSLSYSLGLVLQPTDALYLTVDAYQIDVDDRIVLSSNLTGAGVRSLLEAQGIFGINGGRYFTNAVDTRTRGVDVVGSYRWQLAASSIDLTAGYNYSETEVRRVAPNPAALSANGLSLERIDRTERGRIEEGFPRDKFLLNGSWSNAQWTLALGATRYGKYSTRPSDARNDQTFGAKWVVDASASYKIDRWTLTLGADNVLDEYPDENNFANSTSGQFPYSNLSPFGFNGAYVYGRINYRW
ncbi:TonB-dependent receptor plug domain-containing protein [Xanthomonas maliensis]|uniref:TonB-dependent receptor plug domain-containing protein n=1 Tax=Xanthomonas maliensis TaxID=1321368 RepID=UPI0003A9A2DA|nr:TonB-dependent receptor [Xanthomonas maliensis]KAB7772277.1 TonB-dependent receptor [Xanthomonas maliensis]